MILPDPVPLYNSQGSYAPVDPLVSGVAISIIVLFVITILVVLYRIYRVNH